ncbi:MAG: ParB/RepB/Spo0J family partition protein [Parcubacteria group bacterium]
MAQNYGLGRGLSSLIPQKSKSVDEAGATIDGPKEDFNYFGNRPAAKAVAEDDMPVEQTISTGKESVQEINVSDIVPNPQQPRTEFNVEKLQELADSIKTHGIIQPLIVTKKDVGFELIAGERRLQAAKLAGLATVPVISRVADEQNKLELAIIENVQRHDLNVIEEAASYKKLAEEFGLSQEAVALKMGKSRSAVANKMRLLTLPIEIQKALIAGKITEGHAKLLLAIPNPEKQRAFYEMILKDKLTVRQTESRTNEISVRTHKRKVSIDPEVKSLEDNFSAILGTKVKIKKAGGGGRIIIEYYSQEELDGILGKIK